MLEFFKIKGLVYKEIKLLLKRKKLPALIIALPILFVMVYSLGSRSLNNPTIKIGVCDYSNSTDLINSMQYQAIVLRGNCTDKIINLVKNNKIIVGIVIPKDFVENLKSGKKGVIYYYVDESKPITASIIRLLLQQSISGYTAGVVSKYQTQINELGNLMDKNLDNALVALNITTNMIALNKDKFGLIYPIISQYFTTIKNNLDNYKKQTKFLKDLKVDFIINPIEFQQKQIYKNLNPHSFNFSITFCIISIFTMLLIGSISIIYDKKINYILRIKTTKTSIISYLISKVFVFSLLGFVQMFLIMGIMAIQGAVYNTNIIQLLYAGALISSINSLLGILIGLLSESESTAIMSSLTISLPIMFLSGIFFPLELMPSYVQILSNVVPINYEIFVLKQASVFGENISSTPLLIYLLALITINYIIIKVKK